MTYTAIIQGLAIPIMAFGFVGVVWLTDWIANRIFDWADRLGD